MSARIAFLGGSFDPPHIGHLLMAERAREQLSLRRVDLLVSAQPPHASGKRSRASADQRVAMARLAVRGNAGMGVDEREVRRGGASYTIDTVRELRAEDEDARPLFIVGGDMLADLPRWKEIGTLLELADFAPVFRPGFGAEVFRELRHELGRENVELLQRFVVEMPLLEISSTEIRARVEAGLSVKYLVLDDVLRFIEKERLYG